MQIIQNFIINMLYKQVIEKSNRGGWQSRTNLFEDEATKELQAQIVDVVRTIIPFKKLWFAQMWAAVNKKGDYNTIHQHGSYVMSGAYYLQMPEDCGKISFRDPRPGALSNWLTNKVIRKGEFENYTPLESDLMLWPAFLDHFVHPSKSDNDRIMISFDLHLRF